MSKMISDATLESAQPKKTAIGRWPAASTWRRAASWLGWESVPWTNRSLPAASSAHASAGVDARRTVTCGPSPCGALTARASC